MKNLFLILLLFIGLGASAQYNSSLHTASNKPYAPNGKPTDARSYFYDAGSFSYRPFASRAEILSYLNTTASRTGNFPIFLDSASQRWELSFKNGTADGNLEYKSQGGGGSTEVFAANDFVKSGDTVAIKKYSLLGTIYNKSSWPDLTDFTNNGIVSASIISTKISIQGGTGTFAQSLDLNGHTLLEKWKFKSQVKAVTKSSVSFGFGIGIRADNSFGANNLVGRFDMSTATDGGKVVINAGTANTQVAISSSALTFAANDVIELTIERNVSVVTVTARNVTTNSSEVSASYSYVLPNTPYIHNTGRFAIFSFGGQFDIQSMNISSNEIVGANLMTIGDSKTQGYNSTAFGNRYSTILNQLYGPVVISAGGFDRTGEVIKRFAEIKRLAPKQVLMAIGSNDPRSGQGATYQANYQRIVDSLTSWGIKVFHLLPFYETTTDLSAQKTFIEATYPAANIIDTWTPMQAAGVLDGDGVHPNNAGNQAIAQAIIGSNKVTGVNPSGSSSSTSFADLTNKPSTLAGYGITDAVGGSGTTNRISKFNSSTGLGSSNISDDGSAIGVLIPTVEIASALLPDYIWNKTNAAANQKIWDTYIDDGNMYFRGINDARNSVFNWLRVKRTGLTFDWASFALPVLINTITPVATYNLVSEGKSLFKGSTGVVTLESRPQVDYRWELYHFNNSIKFGAVNDARTQGRDMDFIGRDITFSTYLASVATERFRIDSIGLFKYTANQKANYTDRTVPDWAAVKQLISDSIATVSGGGGGTSSETFVEPNDANYTIATGTGNIAVNYYNDLTADRTITMPTPSANTGRKFTIRNGSASFNLNLSINIYENASTSFAAIGPGQSITFYSNGTLLKRLY